MDISINFYQGNFQLAEQNLNLDTATYLGKTTQERPRQALPPPALAEWVLSGEDLERRRTSERPPQLGNVDLCPVIQTCVEALQHTLVEQQVTERKHRGWWQTGPSVSNEAQTKTKQQHKKYIWTFK